MQTLPYWIQVLQAFGTPAIAVLAIVIGVMQWRTAHQRAVLDLFDKRWTVLNELQNAVATITFEGRVSVESLNLYEEACRRATFLFGPEVTEYLELIHEAIRRYSGLAIKRLHTEPADLYAFENRVKELVTPYMRMHQKAPW